MPMQMMVMAWDPIGAKPDSSPLGFYSASMIQLFS